VDTARLLLFTELEQVLAVAHPAAAVLARGVRATFDRAPHRVALRALQEELHALAPAEPAHRARQLARHDLHPPPLGLAAPVVRDRRHVLDTDDLDPAVLYGSDGGLATRYRALHHHVDPADTVLHGPPRPGLRRELRRERRALARALEPGVHGSGHRQRVPHHVAH